MRINATCHPQGDGYPASYSKTAHLFLTYPHHGDSLSRGCERKTLSILACAYFSFANNWGAVCNTRHTGDHGSSRFSEGTEVKIGASGSLNTYAFVYACEKVEVLTSAVLLSSLITLYTLHACLQTNAEV